MDNEAVAMKEAKNREHYKWSVSQNPSSEPQHLLFIYKRKSPNRESKSFEQT